MVDAALAPGAGVAAGHARQYGDGVGVVLTETQPGSIVQARRLARRGEGADRRDRARRPASTCRTAPAAASPARRQGRLRLRARPIPGRRSGRRARRQACGELTAAIGTVTDLSHGRTAHRGSPDRAPNGCWRSCSPIDFSAAGLRRRLRDLDGPSRRLRADPADAAPTSSTSTSSAPSPASFWTTLCHAAEEVGYEVELKVCRRDPAAQLRNTTHSSSGARSVRSWFSGLAGSS